jgi:hypothetical protein
MGRKAGYCKRSQDGASKVDHGDFLSVCAAADGMLVGGPRSSPTSEIVEKIPAQESKRSAVAVARTG